MAPFQMFGSIEQIGQIKITNVVSGDNIRIDFTNEIGPFLLREKFHSAFLFVMDNSSKSMQIYIQKMIFSFVRNNFTASNRGTRVQRHHIPNKRLGLAVQRHHICNLDHPILVRLRENTFDRQKCNPQLCLRGLSIVSVMISVPLRPAHSMSKLKIRNGATSAHSPSGAWEITKLHATSTSI